MNMYLLRKIIELLKNALPNNDFILIVNFEEIE